ncbi:MAG: hypothetical protein H8E86_05655 [Planctomycetes bacterium]|nr:hypothetical protein [Planctomycetota bacterium]
MYPVTNNEIVESAYVILADPLRLSAKTALPFPQRAASRLAQQRSKRYDEILDSNEDVQERVQRLASIMGMLPNDDDLPSAA